VKVLAEYSMGMAVAGRCGLSCVGFALGRWLGQTFDTVRERLRDWYCGAADKSGAARGVRRGELAVEACFGPLLAWVLADWDGTDLAVALDATTLGTRFVVLAASVVYRGGAVPVAWVVLPATAKGAWKPHWLRLLGLFRDAVPARLRERGRGLRVIVLADRGLYARWLFRAIAALGWHPFLRINTHNADFRPDGDDGPRPYRPVVWLAGTAERPYAARGVMFRNPDKRQACTLLACHADGYKDGWFVVSDLPPGQASVTWYGLRAWIERGFKHSKSGGFDWQDTRMTNPARAARQWLAMAVAAILLLRQGGLQETESSSATDTRASSARTDPTGPTRTSTSIPAPSKPRRRGTDRVLSLFCMGMLIVRIAALSDGPLPHARFVPEPWPDSFPALVRPTPNPRPP
jgi:hypothetical protein